jgi:uncharacterized protein YjbJ (UPF0337 family)
MRLVAGHADLFCTTAPASFARLSSVSPGAGGVRREPKEEGGPLSLFDKISGRTKKAAGDLTGDSSLHREGHREEEKGKKKDQLEGAQDRAAEKAKEVADLERKT